MAKPRISQNTSFFGRLADLTKRSETGRKGFGHWLRNRLAIGFLVSFPLVVTIFFARFMFDILDRWFRPISERLFGFQLFGGGLLLAIIGLLVLGIFATNVFGSRLLSFFEAWIARLPLISPIYQGARQITEVIQIHDAKDFRRVVLLQFPHPGVRSLGFVTREFPAPTAFSPDASLLVFVPTTPNPTSGFLVSVPTSDVTALDISVEEGVKLVISGGLLTPEHLLTLNPELKKRPDGRLLQEGAVDPES